MPKARLGRRERLLRREQWAIFHAVKSAVIKDNLNSTFDPLQPVGVATFRQPIRSLRHGKIAPEVIGHEPVKATVIVPSNAPSRDDTRQLKENCHTQGIRIGSQLAKPEDRRRNWQRPKNYTH